MVTLSLSVTLSFSPFYLYHQLLAERVEVDTGALPQLRRVS